MIIHPRNNAAFATLEARTLNGIIEAPTVAEQLAFIFACEDAVTGVTGRASVDNLPPRVAKRLKTLPDGPLPNIDQIDAARRKLSQPKSITFHFTKGD